MKNKEKFKKDVKEILELLVWVAISAGVVFQANYGCSRKSDKSDNADDAARAAYADTIATQHQIVHNIGGKVR